MSRVKTDGAARFRAGVVVVAVAALALEVLGPASARTHAGPRYGGTLVYGLAGDPNLDPTVSIGPGALVIFRAMCLRLYEYDGKLQLTPVLAATRPALAKDKRSYTVQLRQGVMFNDGTPLNAQAIVTNYQRYATYPGSTRASDFASVDSVTASGPYTVVFHLNARDSTFTGNMYVLSPTTLAKEGDSFGENPVCVGPFMFDHRFVGDNITLIKSPYYYDQKDVYLDKIVYKPIPDGAAAAAALKTGDIQVLDNVSSTELAAIRQSPSLRVLRLQGLAWSGIVINIGNKDGVDEPYANVGTPLARSAKLRQAFEEAIDRNAMNRIVYNGLTQPSCTMIAASNTVWYDGTKVPCTPYDPKDARKLVAASGFPNPTVHLLAQVPGPLTQFIQAEEAAVGINVVIDYVTGGGVFVARRASGNFDTALSSQGMFGPDPNEAIYRSVVTSGVRNWGGYSNPRLDLILANGLKATSTQARSTLYHVAQQILQDDRPLIILDNPITYTAFSTNVTGVQLTSPGAVSVVNARLR